MDCSLLVLKRPLFHFPSESIVLCQVLIIDPTKPQIRGLLKLMESFITHTAPLRTGLVFSVNSSLSATGLDDAGVALLCSFNYITQKKSALSALSFLISVLSSVEAGRSVTVEDVR